MTIPERKKQLRARIIYTILFAIDIILFAMVFHKYTYACGSCQPVSGLTANLIDMQFEALDEQTSITVTEEEVSTVTSSQEDEIEGEAIDTSCWKKYTAKRFRKLGRVKYGSNTNTWYSEKVLPGGGLKIEGRHLEYIDGLPFVCNEDGYIVVACDFLKKGTIVNTCVGRQGIVLDTGAGKNNLDLYVGW